MQVNAGKRRRLMAEINVVPYIDVMLVLLVVFMITAPMLMQGIDVELPQAPSQPLPETDNDPLMVAIRADGQYYLEIGGDPDEPRTLDAIAELVAKIMEENPATPVLVWGDRNVPYGQVVSLMTRLQGAGAIRVGLVTEPPGLEP
jgi:biopolymer transport protein TolR